MQKIVKVGLLAVALANLCGLASSYSTQMHM